MQQILEAWECYLELSFYMWPLCFCLLSQYFTTTTTETKYAFILYETEIWENRPQTVPCLWLETERERKKKDFTALAKMPVHFYERKRVTFILENEF